MSRQPMRKSEGRNVGRSEGRNRSPFRLSDFPTFRLSRIRSALKQIVGMPDYARYLEHAHEKHPGCPLLSEREFYDRFIAARYASGGSRCC